MVKSVAEASFVHHNNPLGYGIFGDDDEVFLILYCQQVFALDKWRKAYHFKKNQ